MKLVKKYKPVISFIAVFALVYFILSLGYNYYLDYSKGGSYFPDFFTNLVGRQCESLMEAFGYNIELVNHSEEPSLKVIINEQYRARIVEGCNSISIIILFLSFVLAFGGKLKQTVIFILAGSVLIYSVNILRISILTIGLYRYPWRDKLLHSVIFPMIIYGLVFILWMIWVRLVSKNYK